MKLHESAIFRAHLQAEQALKKHRKYRRYERWVAVGVWSGIAQACVGVVWQAMTGGLDQPPTTNQFVLFLTGVICVFLNMAIDVKIAGRAESDIIPIERAVEKLAHAMNMSGVEALTPRELSDIRFLGVEILQGLAVNILAMEHDLKEDFPRLTRPRTRTILSNGANGFSGRQRAQMATLYYNLLQFKLANPGGMAQYFGKKVGK